MKPAHILLTLLTLCLLAAPAAAAGSGTAADPYQITTATELQSMNNNLGAYYKLMNNINLNGVTWTPIGTSSAGFHGVFDGNGKTISNLQISSTTQSTGFFGGITSGAVIKDVTFRDCTVSSTSSWTGTVFGSIIMSTANHDLATIDNVDCVRCTVQASGFIVGAIGGLIYTAAVVDVIDCDVSYASVECTSGNYVGAIGRVDGAAHAEIIRGSVSDSRFKASGINVGAIGAVHGAAYAGMTDTEIADCIFEASDNFVGAIGYVYGAASASLNGVDVRNCVMKGKNYVGGIIGLVDKDYTNNIGSHVSATDCSVTDCTIYATSNYAGGIGGRIISTCTGVFDGCTVTGCTILANTYAAGICSAYT